MEFKGGMIEFPTFNQQSMPFLEPKAKIDILNDFENLAWEDSEAFFSLLANCISFHPVKMNPEAEERLRALSLVDDRGISPPRVRSAAKRIAAEMSKLLYGNCV